MSLRLNLSTDYAVRILTELHLRQETSAAVELAEALGMSYEYFSKIVTRLKKAGFIQSIQGCNGGYKLGKDADDISIYDVIVEMEGEIRINRCLDPDGYCSRNAAPECPVHEYLKQLQTTLVDTFKQKKISDFKRVKKKGA